jgi:hypothetical protein
LSRIGAAGLAAVTVVGVAAGAMAAPNASERAVKLPAGHSRPHVYHPVGPSSTTMTVAFNL